MLKRCSSILLLVNDTKLVERYEMLGLDLNINVRHETSWHPTFRIDCGSIICTPDFLDQINGEYISRVVVIVNGTPAPYLKKGVERFIFDRANDYELICSMFMHGEIITKEAKPLEILTNCEKKTFIAGRYHFDFERSIFRYNDKPLYIKEHEKKYLIEWLLLGHKNNDKRMMLFNLRKRFGNSFLRDVDRKGKLKEEKQNE